VGATGQSNNQEEMDNLENLRPVKRHLFLAVPLGCHRHTVLFHASLFYRYGWFAAL